jgi:hypothetical protein
VFTTGLGYTGISKFAATDVIGTSSRWKISIYLLVQLAVSLPGLQQMASLTTSFDLTRRSAAPYPGGGGTLTVIAGAGIAAPSFKAFSLKVLPIEWSLATACEL